MKGIVAEVSGKHAVILLQDGTFKKVRTSAQMSVGSEIDLSRSSGNTRVIRIMTRAASIAAAALLTIGIGYGAYCYAMPYSYVDVDINPSVELTANVFDRIIKVEALNEAGKKLLTEHSLQNARLDDGVSQLLNIAAEHGYLDTKAERADPAGNTSPPAIQTSGSAIGNTVLVTVSSTNKKRSVELKKEIVKKARSELDKSKINSDVLAGEASIQQRDDARALGVTPGKLALIEDVLEGQPELKLDELKNSTVKDLVKKAIERKSAKNTVKKKAEPDGNGTAKQEGSNSTGTGINAEGRENGNQPGQSQKASLGNGRIDQSDQKSSEQEHGNIQESSYKQGNNANGTKLAGDDEKKAQEVKKALEAEKARQEQEQRKIQRQKLKDEILKQEEEKVREQEKVQEQRKAQEKQKEQDQRKAQEKQKEQDQKKMQDQGQDQKQDQKQDQGQKQEQVQKQKQGNTDGQQDKKVDENTGSHKGHGSGR